MNRTIVRLPKCEYMNRKRERVCESTIQLNGKPSLCVNSRCCSAQNCRGKTRQMIIARTRMNAICFLHFYVILLFDCVLSLLAVTVLVNSTGFIWAAQFLLFCSDFCQYLLENTKSKNRFVWNNYN